MTETEVWVLIHLYEGNLWNVTVFKDRTKANLIANKTTEEYSFSDADEIYLEECEVIK